MCKVIIRFVPCRNNHPIDDVACDRRIAAERLEILRGYDRANYTLRRVEIKVKHTNMPPMIHLQAASWKFADRRGM